MLDTLQDERAVFYTFGHPHHHLGFESRVLGGKQRNAQPRLNDGHKRSPHALHVMRRAPNLTEASDAGLKVEMILAGKVFPPCLATTADHSSQTATTVRSP